MRRETATLGCKENLDKANSESPALRKQIKRIQSLVLSITIHLKTLELKLTFWKLIPGLTNQSGVMHEHRGEPLHASRSLPLSCWTPSFLHHLQRTVPHTRDRSELSLTGDMKPLWRKNYT